MTPEERFWSKVNKNGPLILNDLGPCWLWLGAADGPRRYGQFWLRGRNRRAHAVAWEFENGPLPIGKDACHRCDNPPCVNPAHIFPATPSENAKDALAKGRLFQPHQGRTACGKGHPFTPENTYIFPGGRGRGCRQCRSINRAQRVERGEYRVANRLRAALAEGAE